MAEQLAKEPVEDGWRLVVGCSRKVQLVGKHEELSLAFRPFGVYTRLVWLSLRSAYCLPRLLIGPWRVPSSVDVTVVPPTRAGLASACG